MLNDEKRGIILAFSRLAATSLVFQQIILATGIVLEHDNGVLLVVNFHGHCGHRQFARIQWPMTPQGAKDLLGLDT